MTEIVTVTCEDDFELCLHQLASIEKFLDPCVVNVIINEKNVKYYVDRIQETFSNSKHRIELWSQRDILETKAPHFNGWVTQQLLKVLIPINDDYICLDCKDLFVKQTNVNDLKRAQRKRQPDPRIGQPWCRFYDPMISKLYRYYKTRINSKKINAIQTPRYIKKEVVNEIPKIWNGKENFIKWWGKFGMPSEFILNDAIELYLGKQERKSNVFGEDEIVAFWTADDLDFSVITDDTRIVKIHRRIYNDPATHKIVKKWIKNILQ